MEAPGPVPPPPAPPAPEAPDPEATAPDGPDPEATASEVIAPGAPDPEATAPDAPDPEATGPGAPDPDAPDPEAPGPAAPVPARGAPVLPATSSDVVIGAVASGRDAATRVVEYTAVLAGITARLVWHGSAPVRSLVPRQMRIAARDAAGTVESRVRSRLDALADRGAAERRVRTAQVSEALDRAVPLVVAEVVARIDLTALVADNVDLDALAARIDLDAIVDRLDLAEITDDVLDQIDLPEIIRESTGSLGSAAVAELRLRGMDADDVVTRLVDRIFRRDGRDRR